MIGVADSDTQDATVTSTPDVPRFTAHHKLTREKCTELVVGQNLNAHYDDFPRASKLRWAAAELGNFDPGNRSAVVFNWGFWSTFLTIFVFRRNKSPPCT